MENKKITLKNGQQTDYFELVLACLNGQSVKGITVMDMRATLKLIDVIERGKQEGIKIELSPSQLTLLKKSVQEMPWAIIDKAVVEMYDYIEEL